MASPPPQTNPPKGTFFNSSCLLQKMKEGSFVCASITPASKTPDSDAMVTVFYLEVAQ